MAQHDIQPAQAERKTEIEMYEGDMKEEIAYIDHAKPQHLGVDAVAQQTLAEGRSPWKVILANPKLLALIMIVQSNAIIVGVEFSLPGNLLGIQVSLSSPAQVSMDACSLVVRASSRSAS